MANSVRSRALRLAVLLLAIALMEGACGSATTSPAASSRPSSNLAAGAIATHTVPSGATAPVDDATWALVDRLTAPAYTADTTSALLAALAQVGVATFADTTSTTPEAPVAGVASPFELLDFQVHALAVGVWAGAAWSGAELDGVIPLPAGYGLAPASAVLAGYVGAVNTPAAALARALMAGQDLLHPSSLRFPGVVLVLFASDLATGGGRVAAPGPGPSTSGLGGATLLSLAEIQSSAPPLAREAIALGSICSDTATWIQGMITRLFNALRLATPTNFLGAIFATIWNWMVDKLQAFVEGIITSVTDLVLSTVRSIAASIAAVAEQVASVLPYAVQVAVTGPSGPFFHLRSDPLQGAYVVAVSAGDLPTWPAVLQDCANVAKVALPDFRSKNVPLTWGPLEALADPLLAPAPVAPTNGLTDDTGQATWSFETSVDPGDPTGPIRTQMDIMPVAVHRPELDRVRVALTDALLGYVPRFCGRSWPT